MKTVIATGKTRVSAKYIRKLAKTYGIEIKSQLRSYAIKAYYVREIGEAIINELNNEPAPQPEEPKRDMNVQYMAEITSYLDAHTPSIKAIDTQYLVFSTKIWDSKIRRIIGEVGVTLTNQPWYRFSEDSSQVRRACKTLEQGLSMVCF